MSRTRSGTPLMPRSSCRRPVVPSPVPGPADDFGSRFGGRVLPVGRCATARLLVRGFLLARGVYWPRVASSALRWPISGGILLIRGSTTGWAQEIKPSTTCSAPRTPIGVFQVKSRARWTRSPAHAPAAQWPTGRGVAGTNRGSVLFEHGKTRSPLVDPARLSTQGDGSSPPGVTGTAAPARRNSPGPVQDRPAGCRALALRQRRCHPLTGSDTVIRMVRIRDGGGRKGRNRGRRSQVEAAPDSTLPVPAPWERHQRRWDRQGQQGLAGPIRRGRGAAPRRSRRGPCRPRRGRSPARGTHRG